ncbi:site-specific integrase [Elizabethkingia meningoseptica]|uniref:site-specific integrase n=1 Tax=Elizabethkingia meningoseptica TaxID=238 RepID=UPI001365BDA9|nr:site-specific integrase [Elizabethkingia meningoseptica]MVW93695.1 site-specific integrase [Elizabethkingia meningoseptica]
MLKYGITFSLHKRKSVYDTSFPIRARVSFNGIRPDIYTGIWCDVNEWNSETQRSIIKKSTVNIELTKVENIIDDIFTHFEVNEKRFPTTKELKQQFKIKTGKSENKEANKDLLLVDIIDQYTNNIGTLKNWTRNTYRKFEKLKSHVFSFDKNLLINDITEDVLIKFIKYFQTKPIQKKRNGETKVGKPHRNTTVSRQITDVLSILEWANKRGLYKGDLHNTFNISFKGLNLKEVIYLSWEELGKLFYYEFPIGSAEDKVRDVFCFCCFTGLRYSDVWNLSKNSIKKDHISLATIKTEHAITIDLNDYSRKILDKYADFRENNEKALPVISNQKMNDHLKVICEKLEFNEPIIEVYYISEKRIEKTTPKYKLISTHAGRRTFVVNSLYLGIPAEVIMSWTGHRSHKTMKPYVKIVNELKSSEMNKFNKPLK